MFTAILLVLIKHLLPKQGADVQHWDNMSQYRFLPRTTLLQRLYHNVRWRATSKCQISIFFSFSYQRPCWDHYNTVFHCQCTVVWDIFFSICPISMSEEEKAWSCLFAKYSEFIHSSFQEFNLFCGDRVGIRRTGAISFCLFYLTSFVKNILLSSRNFSGDLPPISVVELWWVKFWCLDIKLELQIACYSFI